jgi:hypothetical protein
MSIKKFIRITLSAAGGSASALALLSLNLTCSNLVAPEDIQPGRRDYVWTVDTIAYPGSWQTLMRDIWGSSPNDVYVVGHNDNPGEPTMFRFNGEKWLTTKFHAAEGGQISGPVTLKSILGFGKNDIWVVGERIYVNPNRPPNFLDSSLIIHYDGISWKEHKVTGGRSLESIKGLSPSDIWACGWNGTIWHYTGGKWVREYVNVDVPPSGEFFLNDIQPMPNGDVFMIGFIHQNDIVKTTRFFFKREHGKWKILDSAIIMLGRIEEKWGYADLWLSPKGKLYSCGGGVYEWDGNSWRQIIYSTIWLAKMFGTSEKNIFIAGHLGVVMHYNGSDWYRFTEIDYGRSYFSGVVVTNEVFLISRVNEYDTAIVRGKLKN